MTIPDTCSLLKVKRVHDLRIVDLRDLIYAGEPWATHQLFVEYQHYLSDFIDLSSFSVQAVNVENLKLFTEKKLDDADLSIIEFGQKHPMATTITDDGALLSILRSLKKRCFQVSEYMLFLVENDLIRKREANRVVKTLREYRDIKERKMNLLLDAINLA